STLSLEQQQQLRRLLENGLPLTSRPYQTFAEQINSTEQAVIEHV
ncbi:MAG TPA: AsnC family protein, partial [Pseudomonas sp.]|nr:AsnC family protein [Pseudomonas sp.]